MNPVSKLLLNKWEHLTNFKRKLKEIQLKILRSISIQFRLYMEVPHQFKATRSRKNQHIYKNKDKSDKSKIIKQY